MKNTTMSNQEPNAMRCGSRHTKSTFVGCLFALISAGCANQQQQYPYNNCYPYPSGGYATTPYAQPAYNAYPYAQQPGAMQPITPSPAIGTPIVPGQVPYPQPGYPQPMPNNTAPFLGS